ALGKATAAPVGQRDTREAPPWSWRGGWTWGEVLGASYPPPYRCASGRARSASGAPSRDARSPPRCSWHASPPSCSSHAGVTSARARLPSSRPRGGASGTTRQPTGRAEIARLPRGAQFANGAGMGIKHLAALLIVMLPCALLATSCMDAASTPEHAEQLGQAPEEMGSLRN